MPTRTFLFEASQAGCFHVVNRIYDRRFLMDEKGKDFMRKLLKSYELVCGVEVLTFCILDNHFHLLVRVPHRPEGFDVPLEMVVERLDRALGAESAKLMHRQLDFWRSTGNASAIEEWRKQQVGRMFSLSEFMKSVQLRFSRWYNLRNDRRGTLWERRYTSVIVAEEERALRTIAAYIDLNAVRAGIVADPADYRWCGYAEAMSGQVRARRGLVRIIGQMAWPRGDGSGLKVPGSGQEESVVDAKPWGNDVFPAMVERRALVIYRALLGGQGAERKREDGTVIRRGLSARVRERLTTHSERQLSAELLVRRVAQFTRGVIIGSREVVDGWFEANRQVVKGRSRTERKRGSRSMGKPALRGLYALREVK